MYIFGKNVAKELIANNSVVKEAYVNRDLKDKELLEDLSKICNVNYMTLRELDKMVDGNHQGVVLKVPDYSYHDISEVGDVVVILDHLEDPHNMGAIIRTCEAAGINSIVIPKDRSVEVNSTVMKVSAGTLERVKVIKVTNLVTTINELKKQGYWIIGTVLMGTDYTEIDYNGKIAIVIGNEGTGMSRLVSESCDFLATIPMLGTVNSLNASVAAGIIIFEAVKKRIKNGL